MCFFFSSLFKFFLSLELFLSGFLFFLSFCFCFSFSLFFFTLLFFLFFLFLSSFFSSSLFLFTKFNCYFRSWNIFKIIKASKFICFYMILFFCKACFFSLRFSFNWSILNRSIFFCLFIFFLFPNKLPKKLFFSSLTSSFLNGSAS